MPSRIIGTVNRDPIETPYGCLLRLRLSSIQNARNDFAIVGDVRIAIPLVEPQDPALLCRFQYGDTLEALVSLRKPRTFRNPGCFDFAAQLEREGIFLVGTVKSQRLLVRTGVGSGFSWARMIYRVRHCLDAEIERVYKSKGKLRSVGASMEAILLGNRYFLDHALEQDFQATGIYHVLVIAGLHVGIIAWFLFVILHQLRCSRGPSAVFVIAFLVSYAWMVEARTPIVRAVVMASIYLCASVLERDRSPLNAIGLAAIVICCWQPEQLFDPGFQLSFACVLSLAAIGAPLVSRWINPRVQALAELDDVGRDVHLSPSQAALRVELRFMIEEISEWRVMRYLSPPLIKWCSVQACRLLLRVATLFIYSLAIQISFTLLMAVYFNRASLSAPLLNLLAIPLMGLIVPLGLIELCVSFVSHPLADHLAAGVSLFVEVLVRSSHHVGSIRSLNFRVVTPPGLLQIVYLILIVILAWAIWFELKRAVLATGILTILAMGLILFSPFPPREVPPGLTMTVLDVGQGDSLLLHFPDRQVMLVDGGGLAAAGFHEGQQDQRIDIGEDVVLPYLWGQRIKRLDRVVLTHAHNDHLSGLIPVIRNCSVGELWIGEVPTVPLVRELLDAARDRGVHVRQVQRGERYPMGEAELEILSAGRGLMRLAEANDDDAVVMRVRYRQTVAVLMADLGSAMEAQLPYGEMSGRMSTLLKVSHHGSKTATSEQLLLKLDPRFAIISVASPSPFGHPSPEVLERLARHHVSVYQTGMDGAIEANSDGRNWKVRRLMP